MPLIVPKRGLIKPTRRRFIAGAAATLAMPYIAKAVVPVTGAGSAGPGVSGPFTPASMSTAISWWDGSDNATITPNGANQVAQWNDKIGTHNCVAAFGYVSYGLMTLNSRPCLNTVDNGAPQILHNVYSGFPGAAGALYWAGAISSANGGTYSSLLNYDSGALWIMAQDNSGKFFANSNIDGSGFMGSTTDFADNQPHVFKLVWNTASGGSASIIIDRVTYGTPATGTTAQNNGQDLNFFTNHFNGLSMGLRCGEIVLCNGVVSGSDDTALYNYFHTRWNTP